MNDEKKFIYIVCLVGNIAVLVLTGFLCWLFKSFWGLIPLIFMITKIETKGVD